MKKIIGLALFLSVFLPSLTFLAPAFAEAAGNPLDINNQKGFESGGDIPAAFGQEANKPTDVRIIITNVVKVVLTFLATIFVVLIIFAGFKYMTAGGNDSQIDEAKKLIINAIIGLLIVLSAYAITAFISSRIIAAVRGANNFDLTK